MKYALAVFVLAMLSAVAWREYTAPKRHAAMLAEQCSIQAAKVDAELPHGSPGQGYMGHGSLGHGYSSHYNPATNICYVMFYDQYRTGKSSYSKMLYIEDAFEHRRYGKYSEVPVGSTCECTFSPDKTPPSLEDDNCHSEAEFKALAFKLYGVAQ